MSVHQLKDGRWIVQYRTGKKYKREYFGRGIGAEKDARARDAELPLRGYVQRTPGPTGSPLFQELVYSYLAARTASIEKTTYSVLLYKLKANLLPELGKTQALKITKERIDQYVIKRQAQGRQNATIHREITDIQSVMNFAAGRGLISHNPLAGYKKPRPDPEIVAPPTLSETIKIDKHASDHLRRALKIIFYTGARPGREILGLKWSNVNWDNNTIRIISAKKHGLKYRDVPLYNEFKKLLQAWKEEDKKRIQGFKDSRVLVVDLQKELGRKINDMNIINYRGESIKSLRTAWCNARKKAGITRPITIYSYRHAFVSMLLDSGADLKSVSEIVGHSNPTLTLRVYQHTNKAMHKTAIQKLPKMSW